MSISATAQPISEDDFFNNLFKRLPNTPQSVIVPPGDDCAATKSENGMLLLSAVDQIVGDRHYLSNGPDATHPFLAGRKLVSRNVSDIGAMGGIPKFCLLAGAFSKERTANWLNAFYDGVIRSAREYGIHMIGGDLAATAHGDDVASLTILGEIEENLLLKRNGASPGDAFFATGVFGQSFQTGHHLAFTPRYQEGRWLAKQQLVNAMMDVSDGLILDASRICRKSNTGLTLDLKAIPRRTDSTTIQQACQDGEDYELIFAVSPEKISQLLSSWPFPQTKLTLLGYFNDSKSISDLNGNNISIKGWDHLSA